MSGNSGFSRRHTVPIVSSRSRLGAVALMSVLEEGQPVLADLDLVAVLELGGLDALAVDEGAVQAAAVLDQPAAVTLPQLRVLPRDGDVVEEDPAVRRATDRRAVSLGLEGLPRPAAARADDERRPLHADVAERLEELVALLGAEGLRRLAALRPREERAALRAIVGGLRVLEAALRAVDVAHQA